MAIRTIVQIDEDKCNGCGLCVPGCAEGALQIIDGKAKLVSDVFCDGLGACLGECPEGAITLVQREADDFNEVAVHDHLAKANAPAVKPAPAPVPKPAVEPLACGCPGTLSQSFERPKPPKPQPAAMSGCPGSRSQTLNAPGRAPVAPSAREGGPVGSRLGNWPVQLALVPPKAPYLEGADLVVAADCAPFAYADFHRRFLDGKVLLIGCPKLDDVGPYEQKLTRIFADNGIRSVTVVFMEVPCCSGLVHLVRTAVGRSGKDIPITLNRVGIRGDFVEERALSAAV